MSGVKWSNRAWHPWASVATFFTLGTLLGGSSIDAGQPKKQVVTIADNGQDARYVAELNEGEDLVVKLPVRLGTGYSWQAVNGGDKPLKREGEPSFEGGDGTPGSAETQVFRYRAERVGKCKLEFRYLRPFEKDQPPRKTRHVDVEIKGT